MPKLDFIYPGKKYFLMSSFSFLEAAGLLFPFFLAGVLFFGGALAFELDFALTSVFFLIGVVFLGVDFCAFLGGAFLDFLGASS